MAEKFSGIRISREIDWRKSRGGGFEVGDVIRTPMGRRLKIKGIMLTRGGDRFTVWVDFDLLNHDGSRHPENNLSGENLFKALETRY